MKKVLLVGVGVGVVAVGLGVLCWNSVNYVRFRDPFLFSRQFEPHVPD